MHVPTNCSCKHERKMTQPNLPRTAERIAHESEVALQPIDLGGSTGNIYRSSNSNKTKSSKKAFRCSMTDYNDEIQMFLSSNLFLRSALDERLKLFVQLHTTSKTVRDPPRGYTGLLDWSAKAACLSSELVRFFCRPCLISCGP